MKHFRSSAISALATLVMASNPVSSASLDLISSNTPNDSRVMTIDVKPTVEASSTSRKRPNASLSFSKTHTILPIAQNMALATTEVSPSIPKSETEGTCSCTSSCLVSTSRSLAFQPPSSADSNKLSDSNTMASLSENLNTMISSTVSTFTSPEQDQPNLRSPTEVATTSSSIPEPGSESEPEPIQSTDKAQTPGENYVEIPTSESGDGSRSAIAQTVPDTNSTLSYTSTSEGVNTAGLTTDAIQAIPSADSSSITTGEIQTTGNSPSLDGIITEIVSTYITTSATSAEPVLPEQTSQTEIAQVPTSAPPESAIIAFESSSPTSSSPLTPTGTVTRNHFVTVTTTAPQTAITQSNDSDQDAGAGGYTSAFTVVDGNTLYQVVGGNSAKSCKATSVGGNGSRNQEGNAQEPFQYGQWLRAVPAARAS
ncbi:uncharacterized protein I303_104745 [Kwoniella dejecticola CBS 10117]|uniref:LysM domain-containing protein n=1 Tax=Kwoniella dejecticola CBS 10117 TaxID=1296121 RepID=A0A1A6A4G1_9TREE|nr:uncharacterized protein I303_04275 [Kwoniella dejecticola CBS 10117]OBR84950.1 hypothetical protein I303_04275 [Kwoniella dejecticola CBS 10117]